MFNCYLCEKVSCYTTYFCEDCRKIKNIMNVYGKHELLDILETTCLRNKNQIGYKINTIVKKVSFKPIEETKEEFKIITRSKKNLTN